MKDRNSHLSYQKISRGSFVGRNSLRALLSDKDCHSYSLSFIYNIPSIQPVYQPLDIHGNPYSDLFIDFSGICPPNCWPIGEEAFFTKSALHFSSNSENDIALFKHFRDNTLTNSVNGKLSYELLQFISPLVSCILKIQEDHEDLLRNIYFKQMTPLLERIMKGEEDEAIEILFNGLIEIAELFDYSQIYDSIPSTI